MCGMHFMFPLFSIRVNTCRCDLCTLYVCVVHSLQRPRLLQVRVPPTSTCQHSN